MKFLETLLNKYLYLFCLIVLTVFSIFFSTPHPTHIKITDSFKNKSDIILPLIKNSNPNNKEYTITGEISLPPISQQIITIIPDDCIISLRINKHSINLTELAKQNNCNYKTGFDINVKKYLKRGNSSFEIKIIDYGGVFGLQINNSYSDLLFVTLLGSLMLEIIVLAYLFLRNSLHLPPSICLILIVGLLIRILYLSYTNYNDRSHDVDAHLNYIQYIADKIRLPAPDKGWEYHQAPLYYISAAILYKISTSFALNYLKLLQILSLIFNSVFLIFGTLLLQFLFNKKRLILISTALFTFWPSGIIHSIRIGNDPLYYMICIISLYSIMRWITSKNDKDFYFASITSGLTLTVKLNGIILLGIFGVLFSSKYFKNFHSKWYLKQSIFLVTLLLFIFSISFYRNVIAAVILPNFSVMNGNSASSMNSRLAITNNLQNYLIFDPDIFISQAFTTPWEDKGGRQYFWNYLLKTMLFGEFTFPFSLSKIFAKIISLTLLEMIFFFFIGLANTLRKCTLTKLTLLLYLILSLISLMSFRFTQPFASNQDFRYILPTLVPIIYFYLSGIEFFIQRKLKIIAAFGYYLSFVFCISSTIFFLVPLFTKG